MKLKDGHKAIFHRLPMILFAVWNSVYTILSLSPVIPVWKGKRHRQDNKIYCRITLLILPGKVFARVLLVLIYGQIINSVPWTIQLHAQNLCSWLDLGYLSMWNKDKVLAGIASSLCSSPEDIWFSSFIDTTGAPMALWYIYEDFWSHFWPVLWVL